MSIENEHPLDFFISDSEEVTPETIAEFTDGKGDDDE